MACGLLVSLAVILSIALCGVRASYLVDSSTCRIPDINPFEEDAMEVFQNFTIDKCTRNIRTVKLLRDRKSLRYSLQVDLKAAKKVNITQPNCCLQLIERRDENHFNLTGCAYFQDRIEVPLETEAIFVKCVDEVPPKHYFSDVFFLIQPKETVQKRFAEFSTKASKRPPSVLILGMDTVGRLNFQRSMPKVKSFFKRNQFYDLKGYNKVGDNTYPNLIPVLTGMSLEESREMNCQPTIEGGLENCPLLWKEFEKNGYVTAYTEDFAKTSTFNHDKRGFLKAPVDYYGRSGVQQMEGQINLMGDVFWGKCAASRYVVEHIYNQSLAFAEFYRGKPYFGLFWTNSLTHEDVADMLFMDNILLDVLQRTKSRGILDDSIVIVMGDHGHKFWNATKVPSSAWYDIRLPVMYISLPGWFKNEYPSAASALQLNQNRLTSPYDFHLMLKDILRKSGRVSNGSDNALSCRTCKSLLNSMPLNRTCAQAGIPDQWCTCDKIRPLKISKFTDKIADFLVTHINQMVQNKLRAFKQSSSRCLPLTLEKTNRAVELSYKTVKIDIDTVPGNANYEASVKYDKKGSKLIFSLDGPITRKDKIHTTCVNDKELRMFCEC